MKILIIIETMNSSHGGPPEVVKNNMEIINCEKKLINIFQLKKISFSLLIKCFLLKSFRIKIYNYLRKFDIVHFHELWSLKTIFIVYFLNKLQIKYLFIGHGYLDKWSIEQRYIKKKLFIKFFLQKAFDASCASFFSTTDELEEAQKNLKINNAFIIPNGVSLKKFKKKNLKKKNKRIIVFFGRVHKKKGLNLIINTVKKLPADYFDHFKFEITGPGSKNEIDNLKNFIRKFSLQNKIYYNNPIYGDDKITYLKNKDIFILPSYEEGDSIALKEALGSYLPVIISKQCKLNIVEKYNAGIVIDTNEKSLYEALLKIKKLDILEMGYQARRLVEDEYDNENCSKRLKLVYLDIYNQERKSRDWVYN